MHYSYRFLGYLCELRQSNDIRLFCSLFYKIVGSFTACESHPAFQYSRKLSNLFLIK